MAQEERHMQHELLVVVLGEHQSGKTSVIDKMLGLGETLPGKRTLFRERREGEVRGRRVAMVDTPGWWRNYPLIDTAEFIKRKLVLSLSQRPGPHAFILTVMIDVSFSTKNRTAVEEHLGLFGENIWKHTIVVFTRGESLKGKSIEQHIESEGEALKWLVEKCGNRYCVFDKQTRDQNQVIQLLDKIEKIVVSNSGRHFELDEKTLREVEEKTRVVKRKAQDRLMKRTEHTKNMMQYVLQLLLKHKYLSSAHVLSMPEIRILLVGWVSSRKTSSRNTILNKEEAVTRRTMSADVQTGEVDGLQVSVVDTPGWWKYFPAQSTPGWVKRQLQKSLTLGSKAPHAILLAVPADTTFLEEQRKITEDNMKMFGEQVWRHTVVLFTCGDLMGETTIEEHIESEGEPLQWLVEKCGNRYHDFDNNNRGDGSQVTELLEKIKEMVAENSSYASDTQLFEAKETSGELEGVDVEMGNLLDKEWKRMDRKMEEKIKKLWTQSVDPSMRGDKSVELPPFFKETEPSQESHEGPKSPEKLDTSERGLGESTLKSEAGDEKPQQLSRQTSEVHSDLLEKVKETLEREWGRREAIATERAWGMFLEMSTGHGKPKLCRAEQHNIIPVCHLNQMKRNVGTRKRRS
ncbi:GTPase IMAP family member 8-like [Clupea harengus]|uniref:GTPase IMAP family member 8-like n=1 Tax=Clupea harengus TaxID=7950 RepID=A0A8M1KAS0_CLUHA|nr:GTPase IMAP family member 8-like [Clupea harengus]